MMKSKLLSIGILLATTVMLISATYQDAPPPQKKVFCEIVGTQKLMSSKVTIEVDFGEETSFFADNRIKDEATGKAKTFNSMIDALNFFGTQGWNFEQAYTVTVGQQNVYHFLMSRYTQE